MINESQSHVRSAFLLLQEAVRDLQVRGRTANAAGLKPSLQQRTYNVFSEHRLGFRSFRDFLIEAERQKFIRLRPAAGGDLEVLLPDSAAVASLASSARPVQRPRSIRPDLWTAFNDWTPGWKRLYKVTSGEVYMFPEHPGLLGDEKPEYGAYRAEAETTPAGFKEIHPVGQEVQRNWMNGFVETVQDDRLRQAFLAALNTDRPVAIFTRLVLGLPDLASDWKRFRTQRVVDEIFKWAASNGLEVQPFVGPSSAPMAGQARVASSIASVSNPEIPDEALRHKILEALARMPMAELLRLPVPLEYLIER
jgi:Uncharacterised protein family (UPF0158)